MNCLDLIIPVMSHYYINIVDNMVCKTLKILTCYELSALSTFSWAHYNVPIFLCNFFFFFQGKITAQGKLLLHGMLTCTERPSCNTSRAPPRELHVFLFEQSIIFSEEVGKKTQFTSPVYVYKAHIQVSSARG